MKKKWKALLFNFIGFALLFIIVRLALGHYLPINRIFLAVTAAIVANILAPKFGVIQTEDGEKMMMKWLFMKGVREL